MRAESMKLVKCVYSWETPEDMVCEYVRAVVRTNYYILTVEEERCNHDRLTKSPKSGWDPLR